MDSLQIHLDILQALRLSFRDESHLKKLMHILTTPPLYTTLRIDKNRVDSETAIRTLSSCLLTQCQEAQRQNYELFDHPVLSDCVVIKNRGPQDVTEIDKAIIVDLACGMAVLRGAHVYKQGIMGAPHSLKAGDHVSVYADLDGKCLKGLAANYEGKKLHVGNGISRVARADLYNSNSNESKGLGILLSHPKYEAPSLAEVPLEWIVPQNLPSIACVHILDPQPGEVILDMCAAPGGKTTHISALMGHTGRVIALEKSKDRAKNMEKVKTNCMEIYAFDSTKAVLTSASLDDGPPYPPGSFDRILVDAPCSALGQRPCYVNKMSPNQLRSYPVIQQKLLLTAAELLKPGGVLVYSTCTITKEENEEQVSRLLGKCPFMELVAAPFKLGGDGLSGCGLTEEQTSKLQRFDPSALESEANSESKDLYNIDTIGFFIAKFRKNLDDALS